MNETQSLEIKTTARKDSHGLEKQKSLGRSGREGLTADAGLGSLLLGFVGT